MTKKEANAKMRACYGRLWYERPGAKEERNALMRGKPAPFKAPAKKIKPQKRVVKPFKKPPPRKPTKPAFQFRRVGSGVISHYSHSLNGMKHRPFVVVEVEPGKTRAFYMSTGTGGRTDEGEWTFFAGMGFLMGGPWFIKAEEDKRVAKYKAVARWLDQAYTNNREEAMRRIGVEGGIEFSNPLVPYEPGEEEAERDLHRRLNAYLASLGAVAPHGGGYREDVQQQKQHGQTAYGGAARAEFNPRWWR